MIFTFDDPSNFIVHASPRQKGNCRFGYRPRYFIHIKKLKESVIDQHIFMCFRRLRPTLKPSTSIVSKAQEYIDIYRYPPVRPGPIYPTPTVDKPAAKCRKDVCLLPDCSCGGADIPGKIRHKDFFLNNLLLFCSSRQLDETIDVSRKKKLCNRAIFYFINGTIIDT